MRVTKYQISDMGQRILPKVSPESPFRPKLAENVTARGVLPARGRGI